MEEYRQITLDEWTQWKEDIRRKLAETAGNFVHIGYRLKQIRDSGMYGGAADIFEFAEREYGLGKSTVSRFIAINEKYSEGGNSLELKEEFKGFSSSKLSEMLTLPDSEVELITEKTTIREIRQLKAFNSQNPEDAGEPAGTGRGETVEAAGGEERRHTPLEKCLADFFKDKKDMLNGVMRNLEENPPAYREAAELVAPSQTSHKKGIVFLFLYDWNTGVKYKLMTEPEPVSMSWEELLNTVYGIFGACKKDDVWGDFYKEPEEQKEDVRADTEKAVPTESDQGTEPVATSQQNGEKEQNGVQEKQVEETEDRDGQEAAGSENEESKTQGEACAGSGQAGEPAADPEPADKEDGALSGAGENRAGSGADSEGGAGAPIQPDGEQIEGQMDVTDFPKYMPDAGGDAKEKHPAAAGVAEEPEKPEMTRMEAETDEAAGVVDSDKKIKDSDGMRRHIENQKQIIADAISLMGTYCDKGIWDGLIEEANAIITRAEAIKNMGEMWHE